MFVNRIDRSIEKYKQLFGDGVPATHVTDPDFQDILSHFIFGEIFYQGELNDKERELITLVGLATKVEIFGDVIKKMQKNAPSNQTHIQEYLSAFCFGDFYTRSGLDLQTRELLTLCIVSALGGAEGQVKAHVQGNLNVGNAKEQLIDAITHCLPYMGFPRTLNTLACINEISPEN